MTDISKYIDDNGNFTHTKMNGTDEERKAFIERYKESKFYNQMTESQKIIMQMHVFPRLLETGMFPSGLLLSLVISPVSEDFRFNEFKPNMKIEFDLPPKYRK